MFEDADISKCLKDSAVITGYLVLTVVILFGLSRTRFIDVKIFDSIRPRFAVLGLAVIFNLVFAFTLVDQKN